MPGMLLLRGRTSSRLEGPRNKNMETPENRRGTSLVGSNGIHVLVLSYADRFPGECRH